MAKLIVPDTLPPTSVKMNVAPVIVEVSINSLKVTLTVLPNPTFVAPD